jgi:dTDP-glucose 4,6-dehydratase
LTDRFARDLEEIVERAASDLEALAGQRLYITGGTGFIGSWLLRTIAHANRRLSTSIRVDILTRDPAAFEGREPTLGADASFTLRQGTIAAPAHDGIYDAVIHAATPTAADVSRRTDAELRREIADGANALLRSVIAPSGGVPVLFVSSGAVYGVQPPELAAIAETFVARSGVPEQPNGYRDGKRDAEALLVDAQRAGECRLRLARLFAFLGPGLPLDEHFAGGPIRMSGDGTPYRSYLYPTDLVVWLLAILVRGADGRAYNVGSEDAVSIRTLAERVADSFDGGLTISTAKLPVSGATAPRYVPDISRITSELGVRRAIDLGDAIERTITYHRTR